MTLAVQPHPCAAPPIHSKMAEQIIQFLANYVWESVKTTTALYVTKFSFEIAVGDSDGTRETRDKILNGSTISDALNAIPGVGHVKGVVHRNGGDNAMKSASRTFGESQQWVFL